MLIRLLSTSAATTARLVPALVGLVLLGFGPFACPIWAEEPGGAVSTEGVSTEGVPTRSAPEARPTPVGIVVQWWERSDIVEAIGLRSEQVEALDVLWSEALEARNASRTEQARLFADFTEALRTNAPSGRAALVDRLSESAAAQARLPAELMDRGIAVLDPDQHGLIAEQFPWIFRRSWMGHLTARERRLKARGGAIRIQPKPMKTRGEEHE